MTTQSNDKIQEFQNAGAAIIGAQVEAALKPVEEGLQHIFSVAHDEGTQRKQTDLVQQVWNGVVDISQLSIRVGGAEAIRFNAQMREQKAKQSRETQLFLSMLDTLEADIAALKIRIDEHETAFEEEFGSDWREDMALEILDPDEMPQRQAGESVEDYRERVEEALADELLDEDGNIKTEYEDHPRYGRWAEWARDRHDHREATGFVQQISRPGITEAEIEAETADFADTATSQRLDQARDNVERGGTADQELAVQTDSRTDELTSIDPSLGTGGFFQ